MGTGFEAEAPQSIRNWLGSGSGESVGIIPRAFHHLFKGIENSRREASDSGRVPPEFRIAVQFLELYNEEIVDLLDTSPGEPFSMRGKRSGLRIHEDGMGGICVNGATSRPVATAEDALQ